MWELRIPITAPNNYIYMNYQCECPPFPLSSCIYWAVTLESCLYSTVQSSVKIVSCSPPHLVCLRNSVTRNRATEQAFPPSRSSHVRSHFFATKLFGFLRAVPRVRRRDARRRRSANENRKNRVKMRAQQELESSTSYNPRSTETWKHPTNT